MDNDEFNGNFKRRIINNHYTQGNHRYFILFSYLIFVEINGNTDKRVT